MKSPDWLPEHREWARKLLNAYGLESTIALIKSINGRRKAGRKPRPEAEKFFNSVEFYDEVVEEAQRMFPGCEVRIDTRESRFVIDATSEQIKTAIVAVAERRKPTLVPETAERYFRLGRAARVALFRYFDPIAE
jgi:hypothetical protein